MMTKTFGPLLLSSLLLAGIAGSASAGPCTGEIARAQARFDLRVEAAAGGGASLPESVGARLHRQPTPDSVARAEQMAGEGADNERVSALLAQARKADEVGDRSACEQALKDIGALVK
jgi:hypothetical protein